NRIDRFARRPGAGAGAAGTGRRHRGRHHYSLRIEATFVRSAADGRDVPADGLPRLALVGRSNVGKSSLINALVRQRMARTSAAPGKTRLANIYRVRHGGGPPIYLVDLPGYGYARGGRDAAVEFEALTAGFFGRAGQA